MNCIESAVVMSSKDYIDVESLPPFLFYGVDKVKVGGTTDSLQDIEKRAILETLKNVGGNKAEAAKLLGIGLRTLYRKLDQYNVQ